MSPTLQQAPKSADTVLEPLIFELNNPGAQGVTLPGLGLTGASAADLLPKGLQRTAALPLPEVAQMDTVRHFFRLSQLNHCIDKDFYPLGSCTMKYNPKVCDAVGLHEGLTQLHPETPEAYTQGALKVIYTLQQYLADLTGFDAVTLQPAAGAQGELVGIMMIKAYFAHLGQTGRTEVIVPDSAHGTNPASAAMCGYKVRVVPSTAEGLVDLDKLDAVLSEKTAALMLTNPNTAGLFERDILEITRRVHAAGGLMYYDGANLNAVMGHARPADMGFDVMHINTHKTFATPHGGGGPGCGPVAVTNALAPFLPKPVAAVDGDRYYLDYDRPLSVGKVKAFYGNFEMMVRALVYLLAYGADGLKAVSSHAVLNANYVKSQLSDAYQVAFDAICKHEFILTPKKQKAHDSHLNTMAIAKRLMDYGFHPPTVYFPLIVPEAMMIEPTDTESKQTLDRFIAAMKAIAQECETAPALVLGCPYTTPVKRVDEVKAARELNVNYFR
jgi:glycine dehydrogenase subunit 2